MARRLTFEELAAADGEGAPAGLRWRSVFLAVLLTAVLVAVGLACVWARTEAVRLGFEMRTAGESQRALVLEQAQLTRELAALKAPERIERMARGRLGMREPGERQRRVISR